MPKYPDIELYSHALRSRLPGQRLERVRVVWAFAGDLYSVRHLMIAVTH